MNQPETTDEVQIIAPHQRVSLLHRCRLLFLVFLGINYLAAYPGLYAEASHNEYAMFGRIAIPLVFLYWVWSFRRNRFPLLLEPIEVALIAISAMGFVEAGRALSLFTVAMLFRGLYGTMHIAVTRLGLYLAGFSIVLVIFMRANTVPIDDRVGMMAALCLVAVLARVLAVSLSKYEKSQRREQELNAAGKALAGISVYDEIGDAIVGPLMAFTSDEETTGPILVVMAGEDNEVKVTAVSTVIARHAIRKTLPVDDKLQRLLARVEGDHVIIKVNQWRKYLDEYLVPGPRTPKVQDAVFVPFMAGSELLGGIIFGSKSGQLKEVSEALTSLASTAAITIQSIQSRERFVSLVRNSNDLITVVNTDGKIIYQSSAAARLFGHKPERYQGQSLRQLIKAEHHWAFGDLMNAVIQHPNMATAAEWEWWHEDGYWVYTETIATNLLHEPAVRGIVLNTRDVTERKRLEEKLRHQASHDLLTGLANRGLFQDRISACLSRCARNGKHGAVMYIDLDDFKRINDTYGHDTGDKLLKAFSAILCASIRGYDTAARLGGDEFAVLVEDIDTAEVPISVANRVLQEAKSPMQFNGQSIPVRASIGIALSGAGDTADSLLRKADKAMYTSKAAGKDCYRIYSADMDSLASADGEPVAR